MEIASFKRWHWAVIGLALGLGVSVYRGWVAADSTLESRQTLDSTEFEQLLAKKSTAGHPMVKDIRYFGRDDSTDWVMADQLVVHKTRGAPASEGYVPVKIAFDRPYKPRLNRPANLDANFTVVDYLKFVRAKNPEVRYSTRWWDREPVRSPLFALIGMALLGGICPALMRRAGFEAPRSKESEYDLSRFGKGGPEPAKPTRSEPSEADLAHLRELEAELESKLAARPESAPTAAPGAVASPQQQSQPAPIRKLDADPLESRTSADAAKNVNKQFAGEFYPTETHVKHDKQEKRK
jgi:hypothetical protein